MWFDGLVFVVAVVSAGIAAVAGFGVGSLLTPTFALVTGTKVAVAAVSIPHAAATAVRFWRLRAHVSRRVLLQFGLASAAGGLAGAVLHGVTSAPGLSVIFGALLVFVAASEWTGLARTMRFGGGVAWAAGTLSGLLGGLVGNQGGIRSAALLGFDLDKRAFVATATAIGLVVDAARMPVYLATGGGAVRAIAPAIVVATIGTVAGTLAGGRLLARVPDPVFRRLVAGLLTVLGAAMLLKGARGLLA